MEVVVVLPALWSARQVCDSRLLDLSNRLSAQVTVRLLEESASTDFGIRADAADLAGECLVEVDACSGSILKDRADAFPLWLSADVEPDDYRRQNFKLRSASEAQSCCDALEEGRHCHRLLQEKRCKRRE